MRVTGLSLLVWNDSCSYTESLLQEIGEEVYTVPEVVHESCDRATRQRLQVLPYTLHFKKPSAEAIVFGESAGAQADWIKYQTHNAVRYHLDQTQDASLHPPLKKKTSAEAIVFGESAGTQADWIKYQTHNAVRYHLDQTQDASLHPSLKNKKKHQQKPLSPVSQQATKLTELSREHILEFHITLSRPSEEVRHNYDVQDAYTHTHTHAYTRTCAHTHTHSHTHIRTHTGMHTHMHTNSTINILQHFIQ